MNPTSSSIPDNGKAETGGRTAGLAVRPAERQSRNQGGRRFPRSRGKMGGLGETSAGRSPGVAD